ncbi:uncharacterized protein LOC116206227 [Punica granatum]|uniref:Uncharacterized protein n=2 Tax=Punica granatum TaxID=22663 RepID=A0A2I0JY87_PUNGR|nr:uncharacterized protein LOC116206227 [Punica granatum]PKI60783.1 hypothetical protein CRG98_018830 [Punica granatum]
MAEEDEVLIEVEAVLSVYGDDCLVIDKFPPHLQVHVKPRTADVSSQQFVEAVIGIRAGPQYPDEPPHVDLIECKGLDKQRQKHLLVSIGDSAQQLSSCLMLVALCEEAVEMLSVMNHPDGDCPLCLYPLVPEEEEEKTLPFMKLMSCFHCFHSECIIRWWNWLQKEEDHDGNADGPKEPEQSKGNCPVCRKTFQAKDLEHVVDLVGSHSSKLSCEENEVGKDDKLLYSDSENIRRQKFEAILKRQEEINGLLEPRKDLVVQPGMFLTPSVTSSASSSITETTEQEPSRTNSSSFGKHQRDGAVASDANSTGPSNARGSGEHRNHGMRKNKVRNVRRQDRHWVKKDEGTAR